MRRAIPAILELIGKGLNKQRAPVSGEALPARWVELIKYLNDVERCDRRVASRPWAPSERCVPGVSYTTFTGQTARNRG